MFNSTSNFLETLEKRPLPTFDLSQLDRFPNDEFQKRNSLYVEAESWVTGTVLEETVVVNNKEIDRYPVRINPIPSIVQKHAYALFGESNQDDRPLVYPRIIPGKKSQREMARQAEDILYRVWWESNGRSIQFENGLWSQIYGGCIFKLSWDPFDPLRSVPIRIENPHPKYFVGRPTATDLWRLQEAWIVTPITEEEAIINGVEPDIVVDNTAWMVEHYTPTTYETTINGRPIRKQLDGEWVPLDGVNPWGFVPIVYIPHIRMGSSFYGSNSFDVARGLVTELNRRVADFGDAVSVDSHAYIGMRNVAGSPKVQQIAPNLYAINVGSGTNITGDGKDPDLFEIRRPSASAPMQTLIDELNDEIRRCTYIPKVADGEDEGSQRSGLTLAMRMWPLTSHTNMERISWTSGLDSLNRMILRMLVIKGEAGMTIEHASLRIKENWFPVLPRDREMTVNEAVSRMGAKLGSPEHLIQMLGDVDDIDEEVAKIISFTKKLSEVEAQNSTFGNAIPGKTDNNPKDKTNSATANKSTEAQSSAQESQ